VVAFGTSAPELLVSIQAAISGFPEIAMGNVGEAIFPTFCWYWPSPPSSFPFRLLQLL